MDGSSNSGRRELGCGERNHCWISPDLQSPATISLLEFALAASTGVRRLPVQLRIMITISMTMTKSMTISGAWASTNRCTVRGKGPNI